MLNYSKITNEGRVSTLMAGALELDKEQKQVVGLLLGCNIADFKGKIVHCTFKCTPLPPIK